MGRRTTLKDVAQEAGVTAATVSYVINNTPGQSIRPETRERVLQAARRLNYMPNAHARTLRSRNIPCVGVVLRRNLAVPRFSQMAYGIQTRLEQDDYNVLLLGNKIDGLGHADYASAYLAGRVGGIIFIGIENEGPDRESLELLREEGAPLVVFDCQQQADSYSTVDLDYRGGARLVTSRVVERGCRRVLYLRPQIDTAQERLREQGVRDVCEETGTRLEVRYAPIDLSNIDVWDERYTVGNTEDGLALTARLLEMASGILSETRDGDAIITSWATWTHFFRKVRPNRGIIYAELANNGENWLAANFYTRLPNYETGVVCADEIISLMRGGAPSARIIKLTNVIEPKIEPQRG
ncbi:LacI family DNA-binding transcriptional regulator [Olsenella uli]|uniref:LacI family DNA-binding transcriptional regulator n=1 Tax=Olsenella uli TaxID=133926 RepID=UPI00195E4BB0|nr:LacI family DNA-binding transcriptional regulator [Olsenella uli]MBM6815769.1 LacI family DNA-binding transcriptional regulator [Olsenella uli]